MELMETIRPLMKEKSGRVWTATPDMTVFDALELMAEKEVGALPVLAGGMLVGMISERDYARKVILKGKASRETPVAEIMAEIAVTVTPETTVEQCMLLMTHHRVRHLPVLENGELWGVISLGDLVNWVIQSQRQTIRHLNEYISGAYPG
jgi:CBS domain-containing protein